MSPKRDPRYDILFEPVKIGPLTAPNRFYQVPHCTGMGYNFPRSLAAMRGMKAEGGWGVVCTEYCSIHPTSDTAPFNSASIWDDGDIANLALMTNAVHEHGALAGVELWYGGHETPNLLTRTPSMGIRSMPSLDDPVQSRAMDKSDIRDLRDWHKQAAKRARKAEFDIVYVYACHHYLLSDFLSRTNNTRTDEYGGSLENRVRLVRELMEDTREAIGPDKAVAIRFSANGLGVNHMDGDETRDAIHMLADLADLWDITIDDYSQEMGSSRFIQEGSLEEHISWVREATGKPVVSVGRFTSPDTMVGQIKRGVLDFIGAARPSIADPFLPAKIRDGHPEDIRECIGCNICYSSDSKGVPIRCTQNPTMGEEWRSGWHPENVPSGNDESVLIVGAGPAGLEAAHILGKRGYEVSLADAAIEPGGRVTRESRLPGLSEWARVRDYRLGQISTMTNVNLYLESAMGADEVRDFDADHVIIATGSKWRSNGLGRWHKTPVENFIHSNVITPDDIMDGKVLSGSVTIFDDDYYYMACVIALKLAEDRCTVTLVTTEGRPGAWSDNTGEQSRVHQQLLSVGVTIIAYHAVDGFDGDQAQTTCTVSGKTQFIASDWLIPVTSREPQDALYQELNNDREALQKSGMKTLVRIGDCEAPGIIAGAVQAGHKIAREIGQETHPQKRDRVVAG
ncbi:MAG: FAD-dependent oxidoreductase [Rhodospirillales bacterium]|jgi:dimethylamine/trimethylamine dehydrogenase|nr:FAD-dependent oxidoreductase [Rhodospirillales bacterium]